jgi:hypothetical protein
VVSAVVDGVKLAVYCAVPLIIRRLEMYPVKRYNPESIPLILKGTEESLIVTPAEAFTPVLTPFTYIDNVDPTLHNAM